MVYNMLQLYYFSAVKKIWKKSHAYLTFMTSMCKRERERERERERDLDGKHDVAFVSFFS